MGASTAVTVSLDSRTFVMQGLSAEEKKEVKTLAKAGAWDDIEQKFGAKTLKLARDYIAKKGAHAGANDDEVS